MNDTAFLCETTIGDSGGLARTGLAALNRTLRRNINSARGYQRPIDLAARISPRAVSQNRRARNRAAAPPSGDPAKCST
jgi:hypothetical protein